VPGFPGVPLREAEPPRVPAEPSVGGRRSEVELGGTPVERFAWRCNPAWIRVAGEELSLLGIGSETGNDVEDHTISQCSAGHPIERTGDIRTHSLSVSVDQRPCVSAARGVSGHPAPPTGRWSNFRGRRGDDSDPLRVCSSQTISARKAVGVDATADPDLDSHREDSSAERHRDIVWIDSIPGGRESSRRRSLMPQVCHSVGSQTALHDGGDRLIHGPCAGESREVRCALYPGSTRSRPSHPCQEGGGEHDCEGATEDRRGRLPSLRSQERSDQTSALDRPGSRLKCLAAFSQKASTAPPGGTPASARRPATIPGRRDVTLIRSPWSLISATIKAASGRSSGRSSIATHPVNRSES